MSKQSVEIHLMNIAIDIPSDTPEFVDAMELCKSNLILIGYQAAAIMVNQDTKQIESEIKAIQKEFQHTVYLLSKKIAVKVLQEMKNE